TSFPYPTLFRSTVWSIGVIQFSQLLLHLFITYIAAAIGGIDMHHHRYNIVYQITSGIAANAGRGGECVSSARAIWYKVKTSFGLAAPVVYTVFATLSFVPEFAFGGCNAVLYQFGSTGRTLRKGMESPGQE